jgi:hypothetical protein
MARAAGGERRVVRSPATATGTARRHRCRAAPRRGPLQGRPSDAQHDGGTRGHRGSGFAAIPRASGRRWRGAGRSGGRPAWPRPARSTGSVIVPEKGRIRRSAASRRRRIAASPGRGRHPVRFRNCCQATHRGGTGFRPADRQPRPGQAAVDRELHRAPMAPTACSAKDGAHFGGRAPVKLQPCGEPLAQPKLTVGGERGITVELTRHQGRALILCA